MDRALQAGVKRFDPPGLAGRSERLTPSGMLGSALSASKRPATSPSPLPVLKSTWRDDMKPPYPSDAPSHVTSSTSHEQFRGVRVVPRTLCRPAPSGTPSWYWGGGDNGGGGGGPITTNRASYMSSYVTALRPQCRPPTNPAPYSQVTADGAVRLSSTTSAESFQTYGVDATRRPCPPHKNLPLWPTEVGSGGIVRSHSTEAFLAFPSSVLKAGRRSPCLPPRRSAPYEERGGSQAGLYALPNSTAKDAFVAHAARRRPQQFRPMLNPPPF